MKNFSSSKLIILTSIFLVVFGNMSFFSNVTKYYPLDLSNAVFIASLIIFFVFINILLFSVICNKYTIKPLLIIVLLISSFTAYFMDTYNIIIDDSMIDNLIKTDVNESLDLLSFKQLFYVLLLGILPAYFVYKVELKFPSFSKSLISRTKLIVVSVVGLVCLVIISGDYYASFFREHKALRYYANPGAYINASVKYLGRYAGNDSLEIKKIGLDATVPASDYHRELVIFVLGETAREDHFSLNGYRKKTNPYTEKKSVISFTNTWSCGTSTAYSVPCIFSIYKESEYSKSAASATENLLDVLQRTGVNVLWLDNNSTSKGVADRVPFEDYKSPEKNPLCDVECRDEGMLANLQSYIDSHPQGDIFIVLHQMGNHGPAYYKRYPKEFEKFKPVCKTNQLEQCSDEEINNAYDNALLYTDYFLSRTIELLERNNDGFESAMFYLSDHGESLGEAGLYLHGMPNVFAPDTQRHVPLIVWFNDNIKEEIDINSLKAKTNERYSHDNVFHTVLGLLEINTDLYDQDLDIIDHRENH